MTRARDVYVEQCQNEGRSGASGASLIFSVRIVLAVSTSFFFLLGFLPRSQDFPLRPVRTRRYARFVAPRARETRKVTRDLRTDASCRSRKIVLSPPPLLSLSLSFPVVYLFSSFLWMLKKKKRSRLITAFPRAGGARKRIAFIVEKNNARCTFSLSLFLNSASRRAGLNMNHRNYVARAISIIKAALINSDETTSAARSKTRNELRCLVAGFPLHTEKLPPRY